jgi:hypothetical protein
MGIGGGTCGDVPSVYCSSNHVLDPARDFVVYVHDCTDSFKNMARWIHQ